MAETTNLKDLLESPEQETDEAKEEVELKDNLDLEDDLEIEVRKELEEKSKSGDFPVEVDKEDIVSKEEIEELSEDTLKEEPAPPSQEVSGLAEFLKTQIFPLIERKYPSEAKSYKDMVSIVFDALVRRRVDTGALFEINYDQFTSSIIPIIYNELRRHFESGIDPKATARATMAEWLSSRSEVDGEIKQVAYLDNEPTAYIILGGDEEHLILEANNRVVGELSFLSPSGKDKSIVPIQSKLPSTTVIAKWDKFNQISLSEAVELSDKGRHPEYSGKEESTAFVNKIETKAKPIEELDGETAIKLMRLASENVAAAAELCRKNNIDLQSVITALAMSPDSPAAQAPAPPQRKTQNPPKKVNKNAGSLGRFLKRS